MSFSEDLSLGMPRFPQQTIHHKDLEKWTLRTNTSQNNIHQTQLRKVILCYSIYFASKLR